MTKNDVYERRIVEERIDFNLPLKINLIDLIKKLKSCCNDVYDDGMSVPYLATTYHYEDTFYHIVYDRLETDEEYNKRINAYEKGVVKRKAKKEAKETEERALLAKLKEKYEND